jgi:hypothetical protein
MPQPLLPHSKAKSIGEDARKALSEANGEAEKLSQLSQNHNIYFISTDEKERVLVGWQL